MKIIFYIHRNNYLQNWILNLSPFLLQNNVKIYVFHRKDFDPHLKYQDVELINISKYNITEILFELNRIKPNLFLLFGFRSFFELLLVRICKYLNIRVTYIQHGIISLNYVSFSSRIRSINIWVSLKDYINYFMVFIQYILLNNKKFTHELRLFTKSLFFSNLKDVGFNQFLLFSQDAYDVHEKIFFYDRFSVKIIGYPVFKNIRESQSQKLVNTNNKSKILYIHENFVQLNLTKINYSQEIDYLKKIHEISKRCGYEFNVQLHPMEDIKKYIEMYDDVDIQFYQENNLDAIVKDSSIVIGHSSTALFVPILLGKPLITLNYPFSKIHLNTFEDVAFSVDTFNDYENVLMNPEKLNSRLGRYNDFRRKFLGMFNSYEDYSYAILESLEQVN
jgi:hypothetical protein